MEFGRILFMVLVVVFATGTLWAAQKKARI